VGVTLFNTAAFTQTSSNIERRLREIATEGRSNMRLSIGDRKTAELEDALNPICEFAETEEGIVIEAVGKYSSIAHE
jgi:hypothetical protein